METFASCVLQQNVDMNNYTMREFKMYLILFDCMNLHVIKLLIHLLSQIIPYQNF